MLAGTHGVDADQSVHVIGGGADDGVHFLKVKEPAEVLKELGLRMRFASGGGALLVHVA